MKNKHQDDNHLIGWTEMVEFPDWGIRRLKGKVDTGARSSALHVENIEPLDGRRIRFDVILSRKNSDKRVSVETKYSKRAKVRSSTGIYKTRYFVKTEIKIGPVRKVIEVSLVNRDKMLFRMLLGRKALEDDFIIDCGERYVLTNPPKKKSKHHK